MKIYILIMVIIIKIKENYSFLKKTKKYLIVLLLKMMIIAFMKIIIFVSKKIMKD
jgi:hypothetical protein